MVWTWRDAAQNSVNVFFASRAFLRAYLSRVNALLSLDPSTSVAAVVEQSPQSADYAFVGFEIKSTANEDFRSRAGERLEEVFRNIFSLHFVTRDFGYVCCGAKAAGSTDLVQGKFIPL